MTGPRISSQTVRSSKRQERVLLKMEKNDSILFGFIHDAIETFDLDFAVPIHVLNIMRSVYLTSTLISPVSYEMSNGCCNGTSGHFNVNCASCQQIRDRYVNVTLRAKGKGFTNVVAE